MTSNWTMEVNGVTSGLPRPKRTATNLKQMQSTNFLNDSSENDCI